MVLLHFNDSLSMMLQSADRALSIALVPTVVNFLWRIPRIFLIA